MLPFVSADLPAVSFRNHRTAPRKSPLPRRHGSVSTATGAASDGHPTSTSSFPMLGFQASVSPPGARGDRWDANSRGDSGACALETVSCSLHLIRSLFEEQNRDFAGWDVLGQTSHIQVKNPTRMIKEEAAKS